MTLEVLERGMMADVLPLDMLNLLVITDAHRMATCPTVHKVACHLGVYCWQIFYLILWMASHEGSIKSMWAVIPKAECERYGADL